MFLSIFTDELGVDIAEALPVIKSWGLDYVDLRGRIFGRAFESLTDAQLQTTRKLLDDHGLKVGCLQSSLAKAHQPDADTRKAEAQKLEGVIRAADALDCRRVRAFFFWQKYQDGQGAMAVQPDQLQKTADMFAPLSDRAREAGLILGFENCGATPDEVFAMLDVLNVPEWGMAWDVHNHWASDERKQDTDAYIRRMVARSNMLHVKAVHAVEGLSEEIIPYDQVLEAFLTRGLDAPVSVETHNPDRAVSNAEMSRKTVVAVQRAWPAAAQGGVSARKSGRGLRRPWHDDPVGFAVIGMGMGYNRAREITQTSGTRLIGVCDLIEDRARKAGEAFGVPYSTDVNDWLHNDDVEVVFVLTETGNHGKVAMQALHAGKHVMTTKPMDISVERCDAMIRLAEGKNLLLGVDFDMRHTLGFCGLQNALAEGRLGRLLAGNLSLKVQRNKDYFAHNNAWRGTRALDGGGVLSNQSIHYIDQIAFTVGVPAKVRCNIFNQTHPYIEAEDIGSATWLYDNGAVITYNATTSYPHATWYWQYELHGDKGAFFEAGGGPFDALTTRWFYDNAWRNAPPVAAEPPWFNSMDNFAAAVRDGAPLTCPGRDGRVSRAILDAMYTSAREAGGDWVDVQADVPE